MNPAEMLLEKMKRRNTNERNQNLIAIPTTGKIAAPLSPFNIHKETVIPRKVSAVDSQPPDLNSIKPLKILLTKDYKYEAGDSAPSSVVSDILSCTLYFTILLTWNF